MAGIRAAARGAKPNEAAGKLLRACLDLVEHLTRQAEEVTAADVETTLQHMRSLWERVEVARASRELARQTLDQAQERYAAGITDNLEVVQAQAALSQAESDFIDSTFGYSLAKASLGRIVGDLHSNLSAYLGEHQ